MASDPSQGAPKWLEAYAKCKDDGKIALLFMDHDLTTSCTDPACSCHVQPWIVCPAKRYLDVAPAHDRIGNLVVPHSARGLDALRQGLPGFKSIIYNDGMAILHHHKNTLSGGGQPYWAGTIERLTPQFTDTESTKLVPQGYSFYFYVNETHPHYKLGLTAIQQECERLNEEAGKDIWRSGSYPNGHIIERIDKIGKKQGIINFLDLLCRDYSAKNHKELFEKHVGFIGFADDSPGAYDALKYVKSLPVGYSWQVARDGTIPEVTPDHCNEVVRDPDHMVAILQAMADYRPTEA